MLEAAKALSPIAIRMPLMVSMAVHKLCSSAKIKLALVKIRIPLGLFKLLKLFNRPPGDRA